MATNLTPAMDRRQFLRAAGFLSIGFAIPLEGAVAQNAPAAAAKPTLPGDLNTARMLDSWIRINADKTVTLLIGKVELGQGIVTAAAQVCADELDIDLARLKIISGDTALVPNEGTTAGSQSMSGCTVAVRQAAAEARAILVDLAAKKLGVAAGALTVEDGTVKGPNGVQTTYWDVVTGKELNVEASGAVKSKIGRAHV